MTGKHGMIRRMLAEVKNHERIGGRTEKTNFQSLQILAKNEKKRLK